MCELFGVNSKQNIQINEYLKEFFSHSHAHPHGWGMACMSGNTVQVEKGTHAGEQKQLSERAPFCTC